MTRGILGKQCSTLHFLLPDKRFPAISPTNFAFQSSFCHSPHSSNSCKNFILFHFFVRTLEPDIFWDMNMGRRWAIIINRSTFKYTPSYISDCSFIGLCRIEILSLFLRNCSSKYDTSQDIFIDP